MSYGILINGQPQDTLSAQDRGLHYGDGLFETIAVIDGRLRHWTRHYRRLAGGCERLRLPLPEEAMLLEETAQLCGTLERGVLKLLLTRGSGGRGYRIPETANPTRLLATYPWPEHSENMYKEGIAVRICDTRLARNPLLAGLKHLNRLEQVLARSEWNDPTIAEGLVLDSEGAVISGVMSNLFLVRGGALITPDLTQCGVLGVTRGVILDRTRDMGISTSIHSIFLDDIHDADEAFLCNSLIGIWPIRHLLGQKEKTFKLGGLTCRLIEAVKE